MKIRFLLVFSFLFLPMAPVSAADVTIGVVGCSNTHDTVSGYHQVSSEDRFWNFGQSRPYGGHELVSWSEPSNDGWNTFDDFLASNPGTDTVFWELCVGDDTGADNTTAETVAALILEHLPGAVIYASALDATQGCGKGDAALSQTLVDHVVSLGLAEPGPILTPLDNSETDDGCHGNDAGDLVWGADLVEFFDGDGPPPPGDDPPPPPEPGDGPFADVSSDHLFVTDIIWLAGEGITTGCNPPDNTLFCPDDAVTRGQMAAFLVRALDLPGGMVDSFSDDDGSVFEDDINALAQSEITLGCGDGLFCPDQPVTRQEMASFLVRAYGWVDGAGDDLFTDDDGSVHELDIDRLGTVEVTKGCNPPDNTLFCPTDPVTRAEMAAFLHRAAGV